MDQHTNALTLTQMSRATIENSASAPGRKYSISILSIFIYSTNLRQFEFLFVLTIYTVSRLICILSVPDRLRFLHAVVYPPRWELKRDLADRYRALGVLVSASILYEELELWDDVVESYSTMGKTKEVSPSMERERERERERGISNSHFPFRLLPLCASGCRPRRLPACFARSGTSQARPRARATSLRRGS